MRAGVIASSQYVASPSAWVDAGTMKTFQYERWTLWGWIVRVLLTLLVIGTAIQLIGVLVDVLVG
jgi:hypothetical protein